MIPRCPTCGRRPYLDTMGVYLAAPYRRRAELQGYADAIAREGIECTSSWLHPDRGVPGAPATEEALAREPALGQDFAIEDWKDIRRSTVFVLFTEQVREAHRGGCQVEFGIALEQRETALAIVGPRMNVFHTLPEVTQFRSWADCLAWLRAEQELNAS